MRTAKLHLTAAVAASAGLLGLAGVGAYTVVAQDGPAGANKPAEQPPRAELTVELRKVEADVTAFPELDVEGLEDMVRKCPNLFGGKGVAIAADDAPLARVQKARLNAALLELTHALDPFRAGQVIGNEWMPLSDAADRAVKAAADVFPRALRAWVEERVRVAKWRKKVMAARVAAGVDRPRALDWARHDRLEVEANLILIAGLEAERARKGLVR